MRQPQPSVTAVANVMDVTNFLSKYLSGKQNVAVSSSRGRSGFSAGTRTIAGKPFYEISVPSWSQYDLPVGGFDKYRIFREGLWHETDHIRHTPEAIYKWGTPVQHDMVNIIEDRRIEDLGIEDWPGYLPERLYTQAYAYALRPDISKIYNDKAAPEFEGNQQARYEAFLQRLLIGRTKGELPKAEQERVEETAKHVETELARLKGKGELEVSRSLMALSTDALSKLGINEPPKKASNSGSGWEDTFSEDYAKAQGKSPQKVKADVEKFIKEKEDQAKKDKREDGDKTPPTEATKQDAEHARSGSEQVQAEWEKIQKKETIDPDLMAWNRTISAVPPEMYRDQRFINAMNASLKDWRTGYKTIIGESGSRLSIPDYIRHQDTPFATQLKRNVKGKKMLVLADFSGSISGAGKEDDYKRALVSGMEVLGSIGSNIALFGFGEDPAVGNTFFTVKRFEEPKWTPNHSAKLSAIKAEYPSTPTGTAYQALENYVKRSRPDVFVTVTDGQPDDRATVKNMVKRLRQNTRMVAFGISGGSGMARADMEASLKDFGYNQSFAVDNLHDIPQRLVKTLTG